MARLVVAQAQLSNVPLGLARLQRRRHRRPLSHLDALCLHHLAKTDDEGLDLRLLAGQGQLTSGAAGQEEELALSRLAESSHRDPVDGVELVDGHAY